MFLTTGQDLRCGSVFFSKLSSWNQNPPADLSGCLCMSQQLEFPFKVISGFHSCMGSFLLFSATSSLWYLLSVSLVVRAVWHGTDKCGLKMWFFQDLKSHQVHPPLPGLFNSAHTQLARSLCCVAGVACGSVWCGVVPATVASAAHTPLPPSSLPLFCRPTSLPFLLHRLSFPRAKLLSWLWSASCPYIFSDVPQNLSFLLSDVVVLRSPAAWMDWMSHHRLPPQRLKQWGTGRDTP